MNPIPTQEQRTRRRFAVAGVILLVLSVVGTGTVLGAKVYPSGEGTTFGPGDGVPPLDVDVFAALDSVRFQDGNNSTANPDSLIYLSYDDQVATEDGTVAVFGTAPGLEDVLLVLVDERGRVATERVTVDDDDIFEADDVPLVAEDGRALAEGEVVGFVFGLGRDGVVGDGFLSGQQRADFDVLEDYVRSLGPGLTQQQVIERILDETAGDAGADDLVVREEFRYTDGRTTIEQVIPRGGEARTSSYEVSPGDTVVVRGVTNRKPDDTTITVEAIAGPSADRIPVTSTDRWTTSGVWRVTFELPEGVEAGSYTIEADDGENPDTVTVEVTARRQAENETPRARAATAPASPSDSTGNAGTATAANATVDDQSRTLEIRGLGTSATYSVTVAGEIVGQDLDSTATVTPTAASSTIERGIDRYRITGEIVSFELDGEATVVLDGQEVSPAEVTGTRTNASVVQPGGG